MNDQPSAIIHLPDTMTQDQMSDFAERFKEAHSKNASPYVLPQALPGGYLIGHEGHCGPRCRPLRRDALTGWRFKTCRRCHRRYVWDQGQWRQMLSERAVQRLERELGFEPLDHS